MPSVGSVNTSFEVDLKQFLVSMKSVSDQMQASVEIIKKSGRSYVGAFEAMLNPTIRLERQIKTLETAGKSSADILAVLGEKIKRATEHAEKNGQPMSALVKRYQSLHKEAENAAKNGVERLGTALSDFARSPLQNAQAGVAALLEKMGPTAVGFAGIGAAAGIAAKAVFDFAKAGADEAERLVNLSNATGLTTQQIQGLSAISEEAGLGTLDLAKAIGSLNRQLQSGEGGDTARVIGALGGSIRDDVTGASKGALPVLEDLQQRLLAIENPTLRAELANKAMGKVLRDLIPLILGNNTPLSEQINLMKEAGVVWDDATRDKLLKLDAALDASARTWQALKISIQGTLGTLFAGLAAVPDVGAKLSAEQFFRAEAAGTPKGNFPTFPPEFFQVRTGAETDPLRAASDRIARAKLIASGRREDLDLRLKIADLEERFSTAEKENQVERAEGLAKELSSLKAQLETRERLRKEAAALAKQEREDRQRRDELGLEQLSAGDRANQEELERNLKRSADALRDAASIQASIDRTGRLAILTSGDDEVKSGLRRADHIAKKIISDSEKLTKQHEDAYKKMIDDVRSGAGHVFDTMFQKGKNVFESLTNLIEGLFQTMLRRVFQNLAQMVFAPGSGLKGLSGLFNGVLGIGSKGLGGFGGTTPAATGIAGGTLGSLSLGGLFSGSAGSAAGSSLSTLSGIGKSASASSAASGGFLGSAAGSATIAAGTTVGLGLLSAGAKKGNVALATVGGISTGLSAGLLVGTKIGSIGGPLGAAIGAGIGATVGLLSGLFGGGEAKRARERQRRADLQSGFAFEGSSSTSIFSAFGEGLGSEVEADVTGRLRSWGRGPTINVMPGAIQMLDGSQADRVLDRFLTRVGDEMIQGRLSDDVAWAAR